MRLIALRFAQAAAVVLALSPAPAAVIQFEFNGTLAPSGGGVPLAAEAATPAAAPDFAFTTATIGGSVARVASFSRGTYFRVTHGFAPNGGGAFVNRYTVVMDVMFPDRSPSGGWAALWQTDSTNNPSNDGDLFVDPSGGVGISSTYGGSVPDGTWRRIALVTDLVAATYTSYIDGVQVSQRTTGSTTVLDGRTSLGPDVLVFADNDGENAAGLVNSLRLVDRALTPAEVAALGGPSAGGIGAFFSDDFEGYESDADLTAAGWEVVQANAPSENAAWTITNPGGRRNPPTENGAPSAGKFVISDSDSADGDNVPGTGMSHDLVTPAFSTAGAASVWLHADVTAQLNNGGDAVFDIDVSTDGGLSWTNGFRRVSPGSRAAPPVPDITNADGFFGRLHHDLSGLAANKGSVRLRFRHYEPTDDWWIALDDVLVDGQAPPAGGNCSVLARQTFTGGLGSMKAVSLTGSTGDKTWTTTDPGHRYVSGSATGLSGRGVNRINQPAPAPDFAVLESAGDADDEYLVTPVLNCFSFSEVFLHYKSETVLEDNATQEVLLSTDGGVTFPVTVFSYNQAGGPANAGFDAGEESFFDEHVFSAPQAAGQTRVVFAFHEKSPGTARFWALDDIEVTGSAPVCDPRPCGLRKFAATFDPATAHVNLSWAALPGDEGFQVFQGARQIGGDLAAGVLSAVDATPPRSGKAVVYTLKPLLGGQVERECDAPAIDTFTCPSGLSVRADQAAKVAKMAWAPGVNLDSSLYRITRNGAQVVEMPIESASFANGPPLLSASEPSVFEYGLEVEEAGAPVCGSISGRVVLSPGNVCFADDFEDYEDDVALEFADWFRVDVVPNPNRPGEEATWTVKNPGGRANPPTFDGKASTGRFAISDSDFGGGDNGAPGSGNSNDLWSPSFSCAGRTSVWLHMDCSAQMNNNGKVVFDVDVSTNGGIAWMNVYRRVAPSRTEAPPVASSTNADGFFGRLDVDLSAFAAGKPDVRFRLRSFEPSDDWWVAVDNVVVDDVPPVSGGSRTLLPVEGFADGIPPDWTVRGLEEDPSTWTTSDPCNRSVERNAGNFTIFDGRGVGRLGLDFALLDSDCDPDAAPTPEDDYLITPAVDCSRMKDVYLHWKSETVPSDMAVQEVLLSLDGGASFQPQPVFSYQAGGLYDPGEDAFYAERVFNIRRAALQPNVAFAFHYKSPGNSQWWAVDDVKVSGNPAPPTAPCAVQDLTARADAGGITLSWSIDTDPNHDGLPDCDCSALEVRNGQGSVLATPDPAARQVTVPGVCAELLGGVSGRVCVVCKGRDGSERQSCTDLTCGGRRLPGDCDQSGLLDVSDPVCILGFLFLGAPARLPCGNGQANDPANIAVFDMNGDGRLDLADPISLLSYLFLGGPPAPQGTSCITVAGCSDSSACP